MIGVFVRVCDTLKRLIWQEDSYKALLYQIILAFLRFMLAKPGVLQYNVTSCGSIVLFSTEAFSSLILFK